LNDTERNYEIHDKEILAVIRCLEAWRHFLEGARTKFKIWTDHKNLEYFMTNQKLNRRQARWALFLSRFDFTLKHVPGTKMGKADRLSRRPDWRKGVERNNEDRTLVKAEWLRKAGTVEVLIEGVDLLKKVRESKAKDDEVIKAVEEMKRAGVKMLRDEEWREEDGLMLKKGKVYVPKDEGLRTEIIRLHHDTPVGGHGGQWKTVELVTRNFWWPGVTKEVKRYVEECDSCQQNKNQVAAPAGKLMPNEAPEKPWTHIMADFITKLPLAQGYDAILVVCDRLTKMAHFIPTTDKTSAEGLARLFRDHVWKLHGLPESIISDRGAQFAANLMKELNQILGIETRLLTAFYPQTDGQTERTNQELEQYLRMFIDHQQEQWPEWLGTAEFAYNNKVNTSTKVSPFRANSGRDPRMGFEMRKQGKLEGAKKFAEKIKRIQEEAQAALKRAQEEMKKRADRQRGKAEEYQVGDLVLLSTKDLKWQMEGRRTEKLTERFVEPYKIKSVISTNAVELELPRTIKIHPVVNVSRVKRYREQVRGQKKQPTPPVIIEGEEEYEVEKVINKRKKYGRWEYLVRWKGYTAEEDSWEKKENLKNTKETIEDYEREYGREERRMEEEHEGLPGRFMAKTLYGWDDGKFDWEYLKKLERNWRKWKGAKFFQRKNLKKGDNVINCPPEPRIVRLEGWEERELFSDGLDEGL